MYKSLSLEGDMHVVLITSRGLRDFFYSSFLYDSPVFAFSDLGGGL